MSLSGRKDIFGLLIMLSILCMGGLTNHARAACSFTMADINGNTITQGCAPLIVNFSTASTNAPTWYFLGCGGASSSTVPKATFIYTTPGTYTVCMVYNNAGVSDTCSQTLVVNPAPTVGFYATPTHGCDNLVVNIVDTTPNSLTCQWDLSGGSIFSGCAPFNHTFTVDPITHQHCFDITLISTNQYGCSNAVTKANYICIDPLPVVDFTSPDTVICKPPFAANFTDKSICLNPLLYFWNFGDAPPFNTSNATNPNHLYTAAGDYDVTLKVTDSKCNTSASLTKSKYVKIRDGFISFSTTVDTVCQGDIVVFKDSIAGNVDSLFWSFGPPGATYAQSYPNPAPQYQYNTPGTWTIELKGTNSAGCVYDTISTKTIYVRQQPNANFTVDAKATSCAAPDTVQFTSTSSGAITRYFWQFEDPDSSRPKIDTPNHANPSHIYRVPGTYNVRLTVTDNVGCTATVLQTNLVQISATTVVPAADTTQGCFPVTVKFFDNSQSVSPIISRSWSFGDPLSGVNNKATGDTVTHTYTKRGTYHACLTIITTAGCKGTECLDIFVGDKSVANFSISPDTVCVKKPVTVVNLSTGLTGGPILYTWDWGEGPTDGGFTPKPHKYEVPGTDSIILTINNNGCISDTSFPIKINNPAAKFGYSIDCSNGGAVTFMDSSKGANHWTWDFGDNSTFVGQKPPVKKYAKPGTYDVILTVTNDTTNCDDSVKHTIIVSPLNVDWTANVYRGCVQFGVNFTNATVGAGNMHYLWDFGDSKCSAYNFSTQKDDSHIYACPGIYTVLLQVTDTNKCIATKVKVDTIKVDSIDVKMTATPLAGCVSNNKPVNVTFTDASMSLLGSPITSRLWDFGDPASGVNNTSTAANPTHNYNAAGQYDIRLTITDGTGCKYTRTYVKYISINKPVADFNTNFNLFCTGQGIVFNNTSIGVYPLYAWDFGDPASNGANFSSAQNPSHVYADPAPHCYTVKLKIADAFGCKDSIVKPNAVCIKTPHVQFSADSTERFCPPKLVRFDTLLVNLDTLSAQSITWYFGDNGTSHLYKPSHIYNVAGYFTVTVIVQYANGCSDTASYPNLIHIGGAIGNITTDVDTGCNPFRVCFDAHTDTTAVSHYWFFGDGVDTLGQSQICHSYTKPGEYSAAVLLVDNQKPACQYILPYQDSIISDTVLTNFTFIADTVCFKSPIAFTDSSFTLAGFPITKWLWEFGDNAPNNTSTQQNPIHYFNRSGIVNVKLTAWDSVGCASSRTKQIFVRQGPKALYTVADTVGCVKLTTTFTDISIPGDTTITQWFWTFGDTINGKPDTLTEFTAGGQHIINYDTTGLYYTSLIVSDANGCIDTSKILVGVYPNPNGIGGLHELKICKNDTIQLMGDTAYAKYDWTPGNYLTDSTIARPYAYPPDTTTYVLLTTDIHGCFTLDSVKVDVAPLPTLFLAPRPDTILCYGDTLLLRASGSGIAYNWTPNVSIEDPNNPITHAWPRKTTTYQIYTVDVNGCHITDTVRVLVNVFHTDFLAERVCLGHTTNFVNLSYASDLPITQNQWNFGDGSGNDISVALNPTYQYNTAGPYQVTLIVSDKNSCTDTLRKLAMVDLPPSGVAGTDTIICAGASVQLNAGGGTTIFWTPATNIDNDTIFNPTVNPKVTTTYLAHITNGVCPFDQVPVHVKVDPLPDLAIVPYPQAIVGTDKVVILLGSTVELTAQTDLTDKVIWTPADSLSCDTCATTKASPVATTTYIATSTDQYGCSTTKAITVLVNTNCSSEQIYVGNTFTPNNDGANDQAFARLLGLKAMHYYRIYDRWGNMVFETKDVNTGWNGKNSKGQQLNSGVYVYVVEAECFSGETVVKSGNVTLIK